jgi:hypothetical protein
MSSEHAYEDVMNRMGAVENRIDAAFGTKASLDALTARVVTLESEMAAVETEIGEPFPTSRIDTLESEMDSAESSITTNASNISSNTTNITANTNKIATMYESSTLQISNDTERSGTDTSYTLKKEITMYQSLKRFRIKFSMSCSSTAQVRGRIYKNDIAFGTEQMHQLAAYPNFTEFSEDFNEWIVPGDKLQIYCKSQGAWTYYIKNFRIYYDNHVLSLT